MDAVCRPEVSIGGLKTRSPDVDRVIPCRAAERTTNRMAWPEPAAEVKTELSGVCIK